MTIEQLTSNFELLGDWEERYAYLIDLGKKLSGLPDADKVEENRVHGCQAMVWLRLGRDEKNPATIRMRADSDAFIVRGLIAVLTILFDGKTSAEVAAADVKAIFHQLGLDQHLSPTRKNGLFAMVQRIRTLTAELDANAAAAKN